MLAFQAKVSAESDFGALRGGNPAEVKTTLCNKTDYRNKGSLPEKTSDYGIDP